MLAVVEQKNYEDLIAFLEERFTSVDERLDGLEKRMSTQEGRTANMIGILGQVNAKLDRLEESKAEKELVVGMVAALDSHSKRSDDQWQEHNMLRGQVDRHENWIQKIAKDTKTDI